MTDSTDVKRGPGRLAWFPRRQVVHVAYLANLAWQPSFAPDPLLPWLLAGLIVVVFIPLFVASFHPSARVRHMVLVTTVVLGVLTTPLNVGASVLFVYAGVMAAELPRRRSTQWLIGMTLLMVVMAAVSPIPFPYRLWGVLPSLFFMWVISFGVVEEVEQRREADRLRIDNVRVEQLATSAERERIAMDLHDLLGHSLTSLVVRAQLVQSLAGVDPAAAALEAGHLEQTARDTLHQVRAAVGGLNEMSLEDELVTARRTFDAAGIVLSARLPRDLRLTPMVERSLALALREAVTNVVRHAAARTCTVEVSAADGGGWALHVVDDGIGGTAPEGNGLRGMRERIAALGGVVERHAGARGAGTAVVVTVPA